MEKGYLCEKRCPFFVPGYRYADKGQGGKKHEKETLWENAELNPQAEYEE